MKRVFGIVIGLLMLSGCAMAPEQKQYTATFLDLFDTVTTIVGKADSAEAFQATAQEIHEELLEYHRLFDIYHDYDGLNNLKTVNDQAGIAPVEVDGRIIQLLLDCRDYYDLTGGSVNVAMGSVLKLWQEARSHGRLPGESALAEAGRHMDMEALVIQESASTVYLSDPAVRLDVGAVAKGWAVEQVCENAPRGLLVSVGGNVCATGPKDDEGTAWVVGIQDPDGAQAYLHTLYVSQGCVVTSGDYQRFFMADGKRYHHIIDPDTLYPAEYWRSVSILCQDSGMADALSTALFLLPQEEGQAILDQCGGEAMWVDGTGERFYSPGFAQWIRT